MLYHRRPLSKGRGFESLPRRVFLGAALVGPLGAYAQSWPARPVRVIIPAPAGGLVDIAGRAVGDVMEKKLGQPWLIDPRPGASTIVGAQAFLAAPDDGHTLYLTVSGHATLPFLSKVPFDVIADFRPVAMIGNTTSLICVPAASPADSVAGFIAYANANPGKLNYLNPGNGTGAHLVSELFKIKFDIDMTSITYRGAPAGVLDLLNGTLDFGMVVTSLVIEHVKAGRLRALAVVGRQRLAEFPGVPTLAELGVGDIEIRSMFPLFGPKEMPAAVVARVNEAMAAALADSLTRKRLLDAYIDPMPLSPDEVGQVMQEEHDRLGATIRRLGIKADGG